MAHIFTEINKDGSTRQRKRHLLNCVLVDILWYHEAIQIRVATILYVEGFAALTKRLPELEHIAFDGLCPLSDVDDSGETTSNPEHRDSEEMDREDMG